MFLHGRFLEIQEAFVFSIACSVVASSAEKGSVVAIHRTSSYAGKSGDSNSAHSHLECHADTQPLKGDFAYFPYNQGL